MWGGGRAVRRVELSGDTSGLSGMILAGKLDRRIAVECFLLVGLGVRPAAIVTIPAELPDGDVLGAQVDYEFRCRMAGQGHDLKTRLADMIKRRRLKPLAFKTYVLRSSFAHNVLESRSYAVHREAALALGLEVQEAEVRPTIREWYVSRPESRDVVRDLLGRRHAIQKEVRTRFTSPRDVSYYVYPEEKDPSYLRDLGRTLGYPDCCVEEYVRGRLAGDAEPGAVPEERASRQIRETPTAGGPAESGPPLAFWLKDFFPCRPDCPSAAAKGREARSALTGIDPALGAIYDELCRENLARVRTGPQTIRQHAEWLAHR